MIFVIRALSCDRGDDVDWKKTRYDIIMWYGSMWLGPRSVHRWITSLWMGFGWTHSGQRFCVDGGTTCPFVDCINSSDAETGIFRADKVKTMPAETLFPWVAKLQLWTDKRALYFHKGWSVPFQCREMIANANISLNKFKSARVNDDYDASAVCMV